jgi:hypothetical protein
MAIGGKLGMDAAVKAKVGKLFRSRQPITTLAW